MTLFFGTRTHTYCILHIMLSSLRHLHVHSQCVELERLEKKLPVLCRRTPLVLYQVPVRGTPSSHACEGCINLCCSAKKLRKTVIYIFSFSLPLSFPSFGLPFPRETSRRTKTSMYYVDSQQIVDVDKVPAVTNRRTKKRNDEDNSTHHFIYLLQLSGCIKSLRHGWKDKRGKQRCIPWSIFRPN